MIINDLIKLELILSNQDNKNIAITTHINPDGDGLSAACALSLWISKCLKIKNQIIIDSGFPDFLNFLNIEDIVISKFKDYQISDNSIFDLLIVLDCHEENRIDTQMEVFDLSKSVVFIDHHEAKMESLKDDYTYYFDTKAVSAGIILNRILYKHISSISKPWIKNYADCIYTTILNDTDNFINSNSDKETFQTVADLFSLGLKPSIIANQFLHRKSIFYYRFIGQVLATIQLSNNKKIAYYYTSLKMLQDNHLTTEAYSKMMKWTKGAYDVEIQVLFQEYEENVYRVSLRTETHDVARIANYFGGGGHKKASGFKIDGQFEDIKNIVIDYIESQI